MPHGGQSAGRLAEYPELLEAHPDLVVDGGSENAGELSDFVELNQILRVLVAQRDIQFSNSMAEVHFRIIKQQYFRDRQFYSLQGLNDVLFDTMLDFNNRPSKILNGNTPDEAFSEIEIDRGQINDMLSEARDKRIAENKRFDCASCHEAESPSQSEIYE